MLRCDLMVKCLATTSLLTKIVCLSLLSAHLSVRTRGQRVSVYGHVGSVCPLLVVAGTAFFCFSLTEGTESLPVLVKVGSPGSSAGPLRSRSESLLHHVSCWLSTNVLVQQRHLLDWTVDQNRAKSKLDD